MSDILKWFVDTRTNGYIEFLGLLPVGYQTELEMPGFVWPKLLFADVNYLELVDARGNVHMVKMDRDFEGSAWSFNGTGWVSFISTFFDLNPMIVHFNQIDLKTFTVNFYTKDGDEVDYVFTKDHETKCVVVGSHDPLMYQPIPHKMLLNSKDHRVQKRVPISFNGVLVELEVCFSVCSKQNTRVGVAFTGLEWEKLCAAADFSASKAIIIAFDDSVGSFVGKFLKGVVVDTVRNADSARGETSNASGSSEKSFICEFNLCLDTKGYMGIPAGFHGHQMPGGNRGVWIKAGGRSLYMCMKVHVNERSKTQKNTCVHLVGQMHRLKEVLQVNVGDKMVFELDAGNLSSDEPLFFNVRKLVYF